MAQSARGKSNSPSQGWVELDVPSRLPIIPLVSSVLFPGGVLSLQVGIDRNVRLLKSLPDDQNLIAAFCQDRKSTRLNSSHSQISYAVFCLKKKKKNILNTLNNSIREHIEPQTSMNLTQHLPRDERIAC